uniref:Apple domain-containing protein n=1 Tax=Heterorhabditis bacteriophora TaxID=37862 RepID=A0A1I7XHZ8_HETBA
MLFRLLFVFATLQALLGQDELKVLRPCFERYPNHRLVNVKPYHSEWRMKTEERCLQFCVETASRCRSVVYDTVQHICHFFLDEGDNQAIIAPRMVYFRVVSKDCLDHIFDTPNTVSILENPLQNFSTTSTSTMDITTIVSTNPTLWNEAKEDPLKERFKTENHPEIMSEEYKIKDKMGEEMNFEREQTEFIGSFGSETSDDAKIEKNEVLRDINPMGDMEKRWQSSMEQLQKNNDDYVFKGARMESSLIIPTQHPESITDSKYEDELLENALKKEVANTKQQLSKKLEERLGKLKELYPTKYVEYISSHENEFSGLDENSQLARPTTEWVDEMATKASTRVKQRRKKTKFEARRIKFTEELSYPKKLNTVATEVRRKPTRPPLKQVLASDSSSFIHKARSFLDSVNTKEVELQIPKTPQFDDTALVQTYFEGVCPHGESPVWISFENSMDSSTSAIDSSYAQNKRQCQAMCSQESCKSFTFFDKEKQCMVNINSEGVSLMPPPGGNYTASTSTKFCFSGEPQPSCNIKVIQFIY